MGFVEYNKKIIFSSMKGSYKEVPQTPLVPGGVVHSARFSKNAAFSLTAPAHTARLPDCDGPSFSCTVVSFSPFPKAETGGEAEADVETEVDLSWLAALRPRLLQEGCR